MDQDLREKVKALKIETRAFINGEFINAADSCFINKTSPVDGQPLPNIPSCNSNDIDIAVYHARQSFINKVWLNKTLDEKKTVLFKLANLIETHKEELALLDTIETGRSFKNYYYDSIPKAIAALRYFTEAIDKYYDKAIPPRTDSIAIITKEPLGVVGLITPWNDPLVVSIWKIAPALLMGNSVIIKPAEQSTYSVLKVAGLTKEAGLPDGVFNVVPGLGEAAGECLARHNDVNGIFFTGSSTVGKKILTYAGESNMKKVGLECGGKSPFIVTRHCKDYKKAAEILAKNIFYNQGQICSAPSRAIIDKKIKDEFIQHLIVETEKYIPSDPFNPNSEVGCVISREQKERISAYIESGKKSGRILYSPSTNTDLIPNGQYVLPVIFEIDDPLTEIAQDEVFGPVLVILESHTLDEAIEIANNSKYGLAASVWTNDLDEAYYASRALQAGIIHINSYGDDDNLIPFGGIKESGIGKDKSIYAFDEYSYTKSTWFHFSELTDN